MHFSTNWLKELASLDDPTRLWIYTDAYGKTRPLGSRERLRLYRLMQQYLLVTGQYYLERLYILY